MKTTHRNRCPGCLRYFTTPQGLGLHFTSVRKRTGKPCSARKDEAVLEAAVKKSRGGA